MVDFSLVYPVEAFFEQRDIFAYQTWDQGALLLCSLLVSLHYEMTL